ncbi:hypothetical protein NDU88_002772 [Pleurodeles waltl]|uniref:Uncharacterized protein n=1 Tax=Pleurodeles waltl TaxID=8319 RepID=A0AAV7P7L4_PLEWA|nr:hypothetical protein NDU88_002772 [Pleurodeles waltl]
MHRRPRKNTKRPVSASEVSPNGFQMWLARLETALEGVTGDSESPSSPLRFYGHKCSRHSVVHHFSR